MDRTQRLGLAMLIFLAGTLFVAKFIFPYIAPFVVAVLLAALIDPVVDFFEQKVGVNRGIAVLVVLIVVLSFIAILITVLIANVTAEINYLITNLPQYSKELSEGLLTLIDRAHKLYLNLEGLPAPLGDIVQTNLNNIAASIKSAAFDFLGLIRAVPNLLFTMMIASIATFFISKDKHQFFHFFISLLPKQWRQDAWRVKSEISTGILGLLRSQLILVCMTAGLAILGLVIIRAPYAWLLGLLAGFLDLIPMLGPSAVFFPLSCYYFVIDDIGQGLAVLAVLGIILLIRQLAEPRIVGGSIGLHPLTSLAAIYLGAQLFGISGFLLGPLLLIILKGFFVVVIKPGLDA